METKSKSSNYLAQGSVLAIAGIVVRLIGLLYRIPVANIIGEQGSGYYSVAFEIYNVALILSSYSMPLAVSRLMAAREVNHRYKESFRIFLGSMAIAIISGLLMALLVFLGADWLALHLFKMPGVAIPLRVLSPTILICAILGVLRGLYQGKQTMIPTALSQILEQVVNAAISIIAAMVLMKKYQGNAMAPAYGAAGSTLGTGIGALLGMCFLLLIFYWYSPTLRKQRRRDSNEEILPYPAVFKLILWTMFPVILSQTIYQISGVIDSSLFNQFMGNKGMDEATRSSLLGVFSTKYKTLTNVPIAIAQAIATSMVPSISAAYALGDKNSIQVKLRTGIKFNMMIALPAAVGLGVLAGPIMNLLYPNSSIEATYVLTFGAIAVVFYAMSTITNGALQGMGKMKLPVIHSAIALAIHIVVVIFFLQFAGLGIYSLVVGNLIFPLVVSLLNHRSLAREEEYHQEWKNSLFKPALGAILMGILARLVYFCVNTLCKSNILGVFFAVILAVIIYGIFLLYSGFFTQEDLEHMPLGRTLGKLLKRIGRMPKE